MCLTVLKRTTRSEKNKVVKCYKRLHKNTTSFKTPHQLARVPINGIQKPKTRIKYYPYPTTSIYYRSFCIHGGAIHAHVLKPRHNTLRAYVSYAFNIYAYGDNNDLACKMLYTPACDKTDLKEERVAFCEQYVKSGKPIDKKVYNKLFK